MIDWDLSNFADLYTRPDDGSNQMPYSNGPVSFVAIIFRDSTNNLFVGATYETINRFKWLKQISNAATDGNAAVNIFSYIAPSNPSIYQKDVKQTSSVNLLYEDNTNLLQYIQFDYFDGSILQSYQIDKEVSEMSNKMTAALVLNKTDEPELHFVMSFPTQGAVEIIFQVQLINATLKVPYKCGKKTCYKITFKYQSNLPIPYKIMNYTDLAASNKNFSNLLGISAASKSDYFNEKNSSLVGLFGNDTFEEYSDDIAGYEAAFKNGLSFLNGNKRNNWYYSATAFRTSDQIFWYVQMKYNYKDTVTNIQEFSYPLKNVNGTINAIVVSPDAPSLLISSQNGTDSYLFIDDLSHAIATREYNISRYETNNCNTWNSTDTNCVSCKKNICGQNKYCCDVFKYAYKINQTSSNRSIGLNNFQIKGGKTGDTFIARAQNMQFDNLQLFDQETGAQTLESYCFTYTTVLIEQKNTTSSNFHVLKIKLVKPQFNYTVNNTIDNITTTGTFGALLFNCSNYTTQTNISWKVFTYNSNIIFDRSKSFLNYGFFKNKTYLEDVYFLTAEIVDNNGTQQLTVQSNLQINYTSSNVTFELSITTTNSTQFKDYLSIYTDCKLVTNLNLIGDYKKIDATAFVKELEQAETQGTSGSQVDIKLISKEVQDGLICVEASNTTNVQKLMHAIMNLQTLNYKNFNTSEVFSTDYNLWPYTKCKDRNVFDQENVCGANDELVGTNTFEFYFKGSIYDPDFNIARKSNQTTIDLVYDREEFLCLNNATNDFIYLDFEPIYYYQGTYGYQAGQVQFNYQLGSEIEAKISWYQSIFFMESCQPEDIVWQQWDSTQEVRPVFPIIDTFYYTQKPQKYDIPLLIFTNNGINFDIYKQSFLEYSFTILVNGTKYVGKNLQILGGGKQLYVNYDKGINQHLNITIIAVSQDPYFYLDKNTNLTSKSQISMSFQILNLFVVNNLAPYFQQPPIDYLWYLPMLDSYTINLPDIYDDDSSYANILDVLIIGGTKCTDIITPLNNKLMSGSQIIILTNNETEAMKCRVNITLIDNNPAAPRKNKYSFTITLKSIYAFKQNQTVFQNKTQVVFDDKIQLIVNSISKNGSVVLEFTKPVKLTVNPIYNLTDKQNFTTKILKPTEQPQVIDYILQALSFSLKQTKIYDDLVIDLPNPNYIVNNFTSSFIYLQLQFPNPQLLSKLRKISVDTLYIVWNDTGLIQTQNGESILTQNWMLNITLPIQELMDVQDQNAKNKANNKKLVYALASIMSGNLVLNILMTTSLQQLWGQLNILQFIVYTPLLELVLPYNSLNLCNALIELTTFDMLQSTLITDSIFGEDNFGQDALDVTHLAMSDGLEILGLNGNFIYNAGSVFYYIWLLLSLLLLVLILSGVEYTIQYNCKSHLLQQFNARLWKYLSPSLWVRLFIETNFDLMVCGIIQFYQIFQLSTPLDYFSTVIAAIILIIQFICPIYFCHKLYKNKDQLNQENFKEKFGELYDQFLRPCSILNYMNRIQYNVFYMFRRQITIISIFAVFSTPSIQLGLILNFSIVFWGNNINIKPYQEPSMNMIDSINEACYYLSLIFCFSFTNALDDEEVRNQMGNVWNSIVYFAIIFNASTMVYTVLKQIYKRGKRYCLQYQANKRSEKLRKLRQIRLERKMLKKEIKAKSENQKRRLEEFLDKDQREREERMNAAKQLTVIQEVDEESAETPRPKKTKIKADDFERIAKHRSQFYKNPVKIQQIETVILETTEPKKPQIKQDDHEQIAKFRSQFSVAASSEIMTQTQLVQNLDWNVTDGKARNVMTYINRFGSRQTIEIVEIKQRQDQIKVIPEQTQPEKDYWEQKQIENKEKLNKEMRQLEEAYQKAMQ